MKMTGLQAYRLEIKSIRKIVRAKDRSLRKIKGIAYLAAEADVMSARIDLNNIVDIASKALRGGSRRKHKKAGESPGASPQI